MLQPVTGGKTLRVSGSFSLFLLFYAKGVKYCLNMLYIKSQVSADFGGKAVTYANCEFPAKVKSSPANSESKF